jgi:hypothetical protein
MRFYVAIALSLIASASFASFDLILVTDTTKNCVHRYDGDTGLYLGSFGQSFLRSPKAISLDQANNRVFVEGLDGISAFNYNTGQHLFTNTAFSGSAESAMFNGTYHRAFSITSTMAFGRVTNPQTSSSQTLFSSTISTSWGGVAIDSTGKPFAVDAVNGRVARWGASTPGGEEAITGNTSIRSGLGSSGGTIIGLSAVGAMIAVQTGTMTVVNGSVPNSGLPWTAAVDAAAGHDGTAWGLGVTSSGTILHSYTRGNTLSNYRPLNRFSATQVTEPAAMVVVLAPEPSGLIGLAAATLLIAKRRKH